MIRLVGIVFISLCVFSCSVLERDIVKPEGIEPISPFELSRYLGTWYEIARIDNRFERGLSQVSAEYQLREDGGVRVLNRGYSLAKQKWQEAEGKAYFVEDEHTGFLKVSFFGPFYGAYVIFYLDDTYQHAFIAGPNREYLWFLSRTAIVSNETKEKFINNVKQRGFDIEKILFVEQTHLMESRSQ